MHMYDPWVMLDFIVMMKLLLLHKKLNLEFLSHCILANVQFRNIHPKEVLFEIPRLFFLNNQILYHLYKRDKLYMLN